MSSTDLRSRIRNMLQGENSLKETFVTGLSELLGTAILVFLGCMGCIGGFPPYTALPHLQITVNFGLTVMMVIQIFGHISHAHVNPSITVGAVVLGKKTISEAVIYILSQLVGAVLGYGMLKVVTPHESLKGSATSLADEFCVTKLGKNVSVTQGLLIEAIATAVLMLIACAIWDKKNEKNTDGISLKFGLAVTALATAAGPYTGCSMNPARSLGPAIWNNQWSRHWIYWFGPMGGSMLASLLYRTIFQTKDYTCEEETIPETVALNSIELEKN